MKYMTYKEADKVWTKLNELMSNEPSLKGYRPVIEHVECEYINSYQIRIRSIYDFVNL